ncbi:T9SS type B sorting domain-containing protein [Aquimarina algiphila]|uniref:T9SS type B sorting domain-containing protein n=1 Tax=Aquimarina algiphila TaxID=2047982 RepID=UPI00233050E1|nr:T9SS type B sorting domain-containing protein [Aquimarina algiphila]
MNTKTYLIIVILLTISKGLFAQTMTLTSNAPSNTICRGDIIQVDVNITPPNGASGYNWTNVTTGQFIKSVNGNAGTFHLFTGADRLLTNSTIRVEAFGGTGGNLSQTIDIIVQQPANPGTEGNLLLCNKTGDIDLFTLLQGNPNRGGTWDPPLANGDRGTFTIGTDTPGIYRYMVSATAPCSNSEARVVVKECFNDDFDNDGVNNKDDLDDDNDGILDSVENSACTSTTLTESSPVVDIDFGTGNTPTTDPNIQGHQHNPNWPDDGFYNVANSLYMSNSANFDVWFITTDTNPVPHSDGNGDVNGRFLAVNIASNFGNKVLYELKDIPISAGIQYNFRIDMVGLCDRGCADVPALDLEIIDQTTGNTILSTTSAALGVANDDIWRTLLDDITVPTNTLLTLRIRNQQLQGSNGNDIGIDNIRFAPLECDSDRDEVPNFLDLDSDNDGIFDIIEAGRSDLDTNGDGIVDGIRDIDGDGIADIGVDANGIPIAASGGLTPISSDGDGLPDYLDIDADNDGIQDNIEGQATLTYIAPSRNDLNKNGVDDAYEGVGSITPVNTDTDTLPDYLDLNSDDDCLNDTVEAYDLNLDGISDITSIGADTDNDGMDNAFDVVILDALTAITNPTDNGELPTDLPNNHNIGGDVDFREEFKKVGEKKTAGGCASGIPTINLFDSLVDAAIPGGTWSGPSVLTGGESGTFNATTNVTGTYTYTLPTIGSCPSRKGEVKVSIVSTSDPGTNGTLNTCVLVTTPINLFDSLGGTPDTGGSWSDPNGNPFGTTDQGVLNPSATSTLQGTYVYTVGTTGCSSTANVEVTINPGANAGLDNKVSFCSTQSSINLFDSLGGTPDTGGSWIDPNGNPFSTTDQGVLDPSLTTTLSGDYIYTVSATTCPIQDTAIVTVTIEIAPNPGTNASLEICANASAINLFDSLRGAPTTGGTWTGPGGATFGTNDKGEFNPASDAAGTYTYTTGTIACNNTATITVTINPAANAGEDNKVSFCSTDTTMNLFDSLGGSPNIGGSWTDPNGNPFGTTDQGIIDPSATTTLSGDYTYTVSTGKCTIPDIAKITVVIETTPSISFDKTTCSDDRNSYSVSFTSNETWSITIDPPNAGIIDVTNSMITGIASDTDIIITATNPANTTCEDTLNIIAPDCTCPDITEPTNPIHQRICAGDTNPVLSVTVLTGQTANWYTQDGTLLIANTTTYTPIETAIGTYTYSVEAFDNNEKCPSDRIPVFFDIVTAPEVTLSSDSAICVSEDGVPLPTNDFPFIDTFLNTTDFTFIWSFEGTVIPGQNSSGIETLLPGTYTVQYTDKVSMCSDTSSVTINAIEGPQRLDLSLSLGTFADHNDIIATVAGNSEYEFSLDNGSFQTENIFRNVALGLHEVTVRDIYGCGNLSKEIFVMGFPNFFTPNNDGINDTWNVIADENLPEMIIYIFDRYGKLLSQLNPNGPGWDGIYNGRTLPSTDYWFAAQFKDGSETYRSHFTLKR